MKRNVVQEKSFKFAIDIVELYKYLSYEKKEYMISKQILRSGTSIGANIEESIGGKSEKDFYYKLSIAYKEARETRYWLRLLYKSSYISLLKYHEFLSTIQELCKILGKVLSTGRKKGY